MPDPPPKERAPLTFTFKNIGPIEKAELELGDLTIVAGRNNTGKTYLVYTLYGFLMTWEDWPGPALRRPATHAADRSRRRHQYQVFETICDLAGEAGIAQVPVRRDTLIRERQEAISALTRRFSEGGLADVFSSPPERFENASIGVGLDTEFPRPDQQVDGTDPEDTRWIRYDGANLSVIARQSAGKKPIHPIALRRRLWRQYLRFLFPELPSDPFVLSAERFGISLFYTELDFRKSQLVDLLQKYGDAKGKDDDFPFFLIDERTSRYARPIKDNIDYTRSIFDLRNQKSAVHDERFFNDIKKMMRATTRPLATGLSFALPRATTEASPFRCILRPHRYAACRISISFCVTWPEEITSSSSMNQKVTSTRPIRFCWLVCLRVSCAEA